MAGEVKYNLAGINTVMRSPGVQQAVDAAAQKIAQRAGAGFEVRSKPHRWTARAFVQTGTTEARLAEAKDKRLTRAVL